MTYELFQAGEEPFLLEQPTQIGVNEHGCLSLNAESVYSSHFLTFIWRRQRSNICVKFFYYFTAWNLLENCVGVSFALEFEVKLGE